ncbi:MAG: hypothetical protein ACLTZI_02975 [[Eubacterium] siraeum]
MPQASRKTSIVIKNGGLALLAMLVLHRAKLLASNQSVLALGVAPRRVAGTPVPVFTPFRGKGGRRIGIINQKLISKTDFFYKLEYADLHLLIISQIQFDFFCKQFEVFPIDKKRIL